MMSDDNDAASDPKPLPSGHKRFARPTSEIRPAIKPHTNCKTAREIGIQILPSINARPVVHYRHHPRSPEVVRDVMLKLSSGQIVFVICFITLAAVAIVGLMTRTPVVAAAAAAISSTLLGAAKLRAKRGPKT